MYVSEWSNLIGLGGTVWKIGSTCLIGAAGPCEAEMASKIRKKGGTTGSAISNCTF